LQTLRGKQWQRIGSYGNFPVLPALQTTKTQKKQKPRKKKHAQPKGVVISGRGLGLVMLLLLFIVLFPLNFVFGIAIAEMPGFYCQWL
jgi:hypothetical protein